MTVLFFTRLYYPHIGGVEKHVAQISSELVRQKVKVVVVTELHDTSFRKREVVNGVSIYRIPVGNKSLEKKYQIWQWLFEHRRLIEKADIVHCHDVFFWYLPFRFLYPRKKIFITFHGYEGDRIPQVKARLHHQLASRFASGNISVGAYIPKWYRTSADVITYGAVSHAVSAKQRHQNEIVFVGRLASETAILRYLRVFKDLSVRIPSLHLSIVGEGPLKKEAESFTKKHALSVTFYGAIAKTTPFLKKASFVFSSRYLSTLEAFSQKRFVFCLYNNAIHRDCFALSPFRQLLVYTGSEEELVDAVIRFLNQRGDYDKQIELAYTWVTKQTWKKLVHQYLALWKNDDE